MVIQSECYSIIIQQSGPEVIKLIDLTGESLVGAFILGNAQCVSFFPFHTASTVIPNSFIGS